MGLFNFLKKKTADDWVEIYSPLNGKVIDLSEVPDEAFAGRLIGDGCAIDPMEGSIHSPVDAEIDIFDTKHAVSFELENGLEMIIHFGMDTVQLEGEGFEQKAESGEKVKAGDELVKYNLDFIAKNAKSTKTPVIINNMDEVEELQVVGEGSVKVGDLIMKVKLKK